MPGFDRHQSLRRTGLCQAGQLPGSPANHRGELTMADSSRLVLLARTREGYGNISRLFTLANTADRRKPRLDPRHLPQHTAGVIMLTGGRDGPLSKLMLEGRTAEARGILYDYMEWFGADSVYVELQQNFLQGDAWRNRELAALAAHTGAPVAATNDVHYHARNATGCNMRWWRPAITPPLTKPCAHTPQPAPLPEGARGAGAPFPALSRGHSQHAAHRRDV